MQHMPIGWRPWNVRWGNCVISHRDGDAVATAVSNMRLLYSDSFSPSPIHHTNTDDNPRGLFLKGPRRAGDGSHGGPNNNQRGNTRNVERRASDSEDSNSENAGLTWNVNKGDSESQEDIETETHAESSSRDEERNIVTYNEEDDTSNNDQEEQNQSDPSGEDSKSDESNKEEDNSDKSEEERQSDPSGEDSKSDESNKEEDESEKSEEEPQSDSKKDEVDESKEADSSKEEDGKSEKTDGFTFSRGEKVTKTQ
eukprot:scaffold12345_cov48-Attheya_sp.AAC.3